MIALDVTVTQQGEPDLASLERLGSELVAMATRGDITRFRVSARTAPQTELRLLARDVPAHGGRVFFVRPAPSMPSVSAPREAATDPSAVTAGERTLENEHLRVTVDPATGTLTLADKRTGVEYSGLNGVLDGGDVGDLYNYSPPAQDQLITRPSQPPRIELLAASPLAATLRITRVYDLPARCTEDRTARARARPSPARLRQM